MPNAALEPVISALFSFVVPILVIFAIAGLLLRTLLQWLERSVTRSSLNHETQNAPYCSACDVPMVKRKIQRGPRAGKQFWGCSNYPMCRTTRPLS